MPPKRKSAAAENGTSAKKTKTVCEIDGYTVRWEWEGDGSKWQACVPELKQAITDAYNGKFTELEFTIGASTKMRVLIDKMVQKNKVTGWERRLRCCLAAADSTDFYSWEWQDEYNHWNPYAVDTALLLEAAQGGGDSTVNTEAAGRTYTVDVAAKTQTNDDTGVVRKVRRVKSGATLPAPSDSNNITISPPKAGRAAPTRQPSGAAGKSARSAGNKVKKEEEEEEEEEEAATAKPRAKSTKSTKSDRSGALVKTVVVSKGMAPVDPECTAKQGVAHVFTQGKDIYDVMLNQTNVGNNNNKYFIIQLLEDDRKKAYSVWFRWGRVGYSGQNNLVACGPDLDEAKKVFCKKFSDKTKNDWYDRKNFSKVSGKYDLVAIDYGSKGASAEPSTSGAPEVKKQASMKKEKVPDSKLPQSLQDLINLICDVKTMEDMVLEMKYDARKAPLGKLTSQQIKAGYTALKKIDNCVTNRNFGQALNDACSEFYTRIPHDFGMTRPPLIRTKEEIKAKIKLLEVLDDIEIAMKILEHTVANENPVDTHYHSLKCDIDALDKTSPDFQMIEDYVQHTHATTHNQYKMKVLDVFEVDKHGESKNYNDVGNKMLLWHGSRLTNWMGILSQGLRIAPPEAPVTGYMFGKGIYFADMSSKSANYCFANRTNNTALLLLCEVALGTTNDLLAADYAADRLPKGKHSTKGMGRVAPDPKDDHTMPDGVVVPLGKGINTGVNNPNGYTLNYNEFIVYNTNQVKMKYLVKIQFNFR